MLLFLVPSADKVRQTTHPLFSSSSLSASYQQCGLPNLGLVAQSVENVHIKMIMCGGIWVIFEPVNRHLGEPVMVTMHKCRY